MATRKYKKWLHYQVGNIGAWGEPTRYKIRHLPSGAFLWIANGASFLNWDSDGTALPKIPFRWRFGLWRKLNRQLEYRVVSKYRMEAPPMTTPTLAQFSEALAAVKARYPDAPADLGDGYSFALNADGETCVVHDHFNHRTWLPAKSGEDRCTIKAMEIGAWWQVNVGVIAHIYSRGKAGSGWTAHTRPGSNADHPSLPSAALAMLEVIGGA